MIGGKCWQTIVYAKFAPYNRTSNFFHISFGIYCDEFFEEKLIQILNFVDIPHMLNDKQCYRILGFMVAVITTFASTCLTIINTTNWFCSMKSESQLCIDLGVDKKVVVGIRKKLLPRSSLLKDKKNVYYSDKAEHRLRNELQKILLASCS